MPSPFPGMEPYIERPDIWPDFHDRVITYLGAALKPLLRPRYVALVQDRLFVVESDRPIRPDISIVPAQPRRLFPATALATLEPDISAIFDLWQEEIRQPLIEIIEPAAGNRVVTAIEVLSPNNKKVFGTGRDSYIQKREEYWRSGTNLVEIDVLRIGDATVRISQEKLHGLKPWHYLVAVTRHHPPRQEVYAFPLQRRLPNVTIPLATGDRDITLQVQPVFNRCWDDGPYPEILNYDDLPPGEMSPADQKWCVQILQQAGYRQ